MSSFRSFTRTSVGSSGVVASFVAVLSCAGLSVGSEFGSVGDSMEDVCFLGSAGLGVPALLGTSSSPTTKSGSKSTGSGPFPAGSPSFLPRAPVREGRLDGDSSRVEECLAPETDLEGEACDKRCRACSSAILESIAPLRR